MQENNTTNPEHTIPKVLLGLTKRLETELGRDLHSVVVYGPMARNEVYADEHSIQIMVVVASIDPETLQALIAPIRYWLDKGHPMPKLFSPSLLASSADVFPLEFLEMSAHHYMAFGSDPFAKVPIHKDHLRLQCEREFRQKMMLLNEEYILCRGNERRIRALLTQSYLSFVDIFRGCLRLQSESIPRPDYDVTTQFCQQSNILRSPFSEIELLIRKQKATRSSHEIFCDYYQQLTIAVDSINDFESRKEH